MPEYAALLLTDVVDSTATNDAIGDAAMGRLWQEHDRIARGLARQWRGREIGRSDGFLLVFANADDAASFARAYHGGLARLSFAMRARVGIHVGYIDLRQNSAEDTAAGATRFDLDGVALPVCARIAALARGGQTLLSAEAKAQLSEESWIAASHGHWQLKGIAEPIELFEIEEAGSAFLPPQDGEKGYRVVHQQDGWYPAREIRNSVPAERDAFVGRSGDLQLLAVHLGSGIRLVSVVGIGGVGKTRMVVHYARRWLGEFVGGAWFCDLAEARDASGIASAVARGLEIPLAEGDPVRCLADAMASKARCLIVLDNFEQVSQFAPETLGVWLDRCPEARFIVTTRERLGLPGEHVVRLQSLIAGDASALFMRRAAAHDPERCLGPDDRPAIDDLVKLLDGLPLAIELAAGRLGVMGPKQMLKRLGERFDLLSARTGRHRRQATLRAAFDWSWELLTRNEQWLLAQSSVFAGGFTLQAGEDILRPCDGDGRTTVVDALQSLAEKSFLRLDGERFSLLVSVREYAAERLATLRDTDPDAALVLHGIESRHGRFFVRPVKVDANGTAELANILIACQRAIGDQDADVFVPGCSNAWRILEARGPCGLAAELVESALKVPGLTTLQRVPLVYIRGRCFLVMGDPESARRELEHVLASARNEALAFEELKALSSLAELDVIEGHLEEAKLQYEEVVRRAAGLDDASLFCAAVNGLGSYFNRVGEFSAARAQFHLGLDAARQHSEKRWEGGALANLGNVEASLGNRPQAKLHYDDAIVVAMQLGDRVTEGNLCCNLGLFELEEGNAEASRVYLVRALAVARDDGLSLLESVVLCNLGLLNESIGSNADAETAYRSALRIARQRGDHRSQGQVLGYLGLLVGKRGAADLGRTLLEEGISLLRRIKDQLSLAIALTRFAQGAPIWNDIEGGMAALAEASRLGDDIAVSSNSELAISLEAARRVLEDASRGG